MVIVTIEFFIGARDDHCIEDQAIGCKIAVFMFELEGVDVDFCQSSEGVLQWAGAPVGEDVQIAGTVPTRPAERFNNVRIFSFGRNEEDWTRRCESRI